MKNVIDFNVNDIIEEYHIERGFGYKKFLVTNKIVTEHRGTFYDVLSIETDEKPEIFRGLHLQDSKKSKVQYRKFFDAKKQV